VDRLRGFAARDEGERRVLQDHGEDHDRLVDTLEACVRRIGTLADERR